MEYILASKSPRRKELMKEISPIFNIVTKEINEHDFTCKNPIKTVKNISFHKGNDIAKDHPNSLVISADTIVVYKNKIYGKPLNEEDAFNILKTLSGHTHKVITGYTIFYKNKVVTCSVTSFVKFNEINNELINEYIKSKSPLDKAGAYGIQDNVRYPIIKKIKGSYKNVVGFPTDEIKNSINRLINK